MKHLYTLLLSCCLISYQECFAQTSFDDSKYTRILYRINVGGVGTASHDNTNVPWANDNFNNPSPFSNVGITGNKVYTTEDSIYFDSSIPEGTPDFLFKNERSIESWDVKSFEWDFPVDSDSKVEVRLYFADIYFFDAGIRKFDVKLEDQIVESSLDIAGTYGHNVAVLKTYQATSDGNIDIDLIQIKGQPVLSAIEIFEVREPMVTAVPAPAENSPLYATPNPFTDYIKIPAKGNGYSIYNCSGMLIETTEHAITDNSTTHIATTNLSPGLYILKYGNQSELILKK